MAKPKGLGRGLDALLGGEDNAAPPQGDLRLMNVSQLAPGKYQPRTQMDSESLQELADSIRAQGLMQPILAREVASGFEIIAGERRWRAAQMAGLNEVPVLVREVADDAVAAMALIENIQREDLNAIDEAHGLQRLIHEFGMTHDAVALGGRQIARGGVQPVAAVESVATGAGHAHRGADRNGPCARAAAAFTRTCSANWRTRSRPGRCRCAKSSAGSRNSKMA